MSTAATETGETPAKHRYDERDRRLVLARVGVSVGALLIGAIAGLPQVMERAGRIRLPAGIDSRKMEKRCVVFGRFRSFPAKRRGCRTKPHASSPGPPLAEEAGNPPCRRAPENRDGK